MFNCQSKMNDEVWMGTITLSHKISIGDLNIFSVLVAFQQINDINWMSKCFEQHVPFTCTCEITSIGCCLHEWPGNQQP